MEGRRRKIPAVARELMVTFGISESDAMEIHGHPHCGHVVAYALARNISIAESRSEGKLWRISDGNGDYALAWAVTAYEAWQQARRSISTRPAFPQCVCEEVR